MIQELFSWLDAQRITYIPVDTEVVDIPGFGRLFTADLSGVESIFRGDGDKLVFNLMESPDVLMEEGIFHVAFPFGRNWYYYDLREEFRFNLLKYIGRPKPPVHDVPFVNLGIHTSYEPAARRKICAARRNGSGIRLSASATAIQWPPR